MAYSNLKMKEGLMINDVNYIIAKLETIHEDIVLLKTQVDELRQAETGRKAVSKFVIGTIAIIGATVGWLVDNAITVAQHIQIKGKSDGTV